MKAILTKIHPLKESKTEASYIRIEFELEDRSWAKSDLVPGYRNYKRWQPILKLGVGTTLRNLYLQDRNEVDADSFPEIVSGPDLLNPYIPPIRKRRKKKERCPKCKAILSKVADAKPTEKKNTMLVTMYLICPNKIDCGFKEETDF